MLNLETHLDTHSIHDEPNLTDRLSQHDLEAIGVWCWEGFRADKASRDKWERRTQAAMDLALQLTKAKSFPWPGSANVAFPLVTIACLQFHSRAYPALIQGPDVVRYRVNGEDPTGQSTARAQRVGAHMSWQVLEEDQAWEEGHDRMLLSVPIVGCAFQKTYYNPATRTNMSELVLAQDLILDYYAKSVESCARKTQVFCAPRNELYAGIMEGRYRDVREEPWYKAPAAPLQIEPGATRKDARTGATPPQPDELSEYTLLEQHCWMDLDGDGYAEPYVVTLEGNSRCVLRIVARWDSPKQINRNLRGEVVSITPTEYFTKYSFIPSPDGGVYDLGFGQLLGPLNSATNAIVNQLLDAGTLATTAGGFLGRGVKLRGGQYQFTQFGWNRVDTTGEDLSKNIFPMPVREPSPVLFQLLGLLIQYTSRVAGVTDTMAGENPGQNTPAQTTQSMIEQGMKIYSAIFKRIWRSMKEEFRKLYLLNATYLPDSQTYGPDGGKALREDYLADPRNICPVADPNVTSDQQQLQLALTLKQAAGSTPGYDLEAVERNFLRALKVDGTSVLYPGPKKVPPLPNAKLQIEQMKLQVKQLELQARQQEFVMSLIEQRRLNDAKISQLEAQAKKLLSDADASVAGHEIAVFNAALGALKANDESLRAHLDLMLRHMETRDADRDTTPPATRGGMEGMAPAPINPGIPGMAPASSGGGA